MAVAQVIDYRKGWAGNHAVCPRSLSPRFTPKPLLCRLCGNAAVIRVMPAERRAWRTHEAGLKGSCRHWLVRRHPPSKVRLMCADLRSPSRPNTKRLASPCELLVMMLLLLHVHCTRSHSNKLGQGTRLRPGSAARPCRAAAGVGAGSAAAGR